MGILNFLPLSAWNILSENKPIGLFRKPSLFTNCNKEMAFNVHSMVIIRQDKNTYKCNAIVFLIASITSRMGKVHIYQGTAAICHRLQKNGLTFQLIGSDIVSDMCQYKEVSIRFDFVLCRMLY